MLHKQQQKYYQAHSILQGVQNFTILRYCHAPNYPLNLMLNGINTLLYQLKEKI